MFPRQRFQRDVPEPFSAYDQDGQGFQELNVFANVVLIDSPALLQPTKMPFAISKAHISGTTTSASSTCCSTVRL